MLTRLVLAMFSMEDVALPVDPVVGDVLVVVSDRLATYL